MESMQIIIKSQTSKLWIFGGRIKQKIGYFKSLRICMDTDPNKWFTYMLAAAKEIVPAASTTPAPVAPTEPSADVAMRAEIMAFREELRALAQAKQGFESVPTESGFLSVEGTPDAEPEYCFHACGHTADQCLALTPAASGGDYVTTFNCPKTTLPQLPEMEITMTDKNHQSVSLLTLYWLPVFLFLLGVLLIITSALLLWPQPVVESSPEPVCPMKNGVFTTNIFPDDFTTAISTDSPLECAFPGNTGVFTTDIFPDDFTTAISTDFMVEAAFPAKSGTNHSEPCDVLVDMGATSHILALPDKYFIRPQRVRTPIKQLDGIVYSLLRGDVAYKYVDSEGVPRVSTFYNSLQSPPGSTEYLASISKWQKVLTHSTTYKTQPMSLISTTPSLSLLGVAQLMPKIK